MHGDFWETEVAIRTNSVGNQISQFFAVLSPHLGNCFKFFILLKLNEVAYMMNETVYLESVLILGAPRILLLFHTRGVDVTKRTETDAFSCSLLLGIRCCYCMSGCPFSFSFIGHIFAKIKICHNLVYALNLVTFLLLSTNTALFFTPSFVDYSSHKCFFSKST